MAWRGSFRVGRSMFARGKVESCIEACVVGLGWTAGNPALHDAIAVMRPCEILVWVTLCHPGIFAAVTDPTRDRTGREQSQLPESALAPQKHGHPFRHGSPTASPSPCPCRTSSSSSPDSNPSSHSSSSPAPLCTSSQNTHCPSLLPPPPPSTLSSSPPSSNARYKTPSALPLACPSARTAAPPSSWRLSCRSASGRGWSACAEGRGRASGRG